MIGPAFYFHGKSCRHHFLLPPASSFSSSSSSSSSSFLLFLSFFSFFNSMEAVVPANTQLLDLGFPYPEQDDDVLFPLIGGRMLSAAPSPDSRHYTESPAGLGILSDSEGNHGDAASSPDSTYVSFDDGTLDFFSTDSHDSMMMMDPLEFIQAQIYEENVENGVVPGENPSIFVGNSAVEAGQASEHPDMAGPGGAASWGTATYYGHFGQDPEVAERSKKRKVNHGKGSPLVNQTPIIPVHSMSPEAPTAFSQAVYPSESFFLGNPIGARAILPKHAKASPLAGSPPPVTPNTTGKSKSPAKRRGEAGDVNIFPEDLTQQLFQASHLPFSFPPFLDTHGSGWLFTAGLRGSRDRS